MTQPQPSKRRQRLEGIQQPLATTNPSLWFHRFLDNRKPENATNNAELIKEVASISESPTYDAFFSRWQTQLETIRVAIDGCEYRVIAKPATAQGRLAIGLGDESVIETAVTLHHTYGVPYLPGSALKGLAAAYAHQRLEGDEWRKAIYEDGKLIKQAGDAHTAMFGTTSSAGYITFFDALYAPDSGHKGKPLWPDVITVHHPNYYTGSNPMPPADWDSPTPVPFLTATGTYLVALGGPFAWVELAFKLLGKALEEMGVGAKTSSGYGRMTFNIAQKPTETHPDQEEPGLQLHNDLPQTPEQQKPQEKAIEPPRPGRDVWGKVIDRRDKRWIVRLEEGGFEVRASDKQAKRRVDFGLRVRVRIERTDPLEGSIKDVIG